MLPPTAPAPLLLKIPVGPDVKVVTLVPTLLEFVNFRELIADIPLADQAVPAIFVLAGPATSPLMPDAPPPPVKVNMVPELLPTNLVVPPAVAT